MNKNRTNTTHTHTHFTPIRIVVGGAEYELSLKIWLCGGRILESACSRVGHIDRPLRHATFAHIKYDFISAVCSSSSSHTHTHIALDLYVNFDIFTFPFIHFQINFRISNESLKCGWANTKSFTID